MTAIRRSIHGQWSSVWAFILAATGSAVGLGNIWKFPYITGKNGGGAFVLVYLICVLVIGIPIMMAEILMGRRGRQSPLNTLRTLAEEAGRNLRWRYLGGAGMLAGILILSYYSVVAGWACAYVFRTGAGVFNGATADGVSSIFSALVEDPERLLAWHTIFTLGTVIMVSRGVRSGLEQAVRLMMPALFLILLVLLGYALNTGAFPQAARFLFHPDFSQITGTGILIAMGQAFFTLSLGMGAIMVYGSYLSERASIAGTTFIIALADTLVALLAGLAIFPIVFANGLQPGEGAGLIFVTLPIAFGSMPYGAFFGSLFFVLVVFAAWSSAISLMEPTVAWLVEKHAVNRVWASALTGLTCWLVGLVSLFSFNIWSGYQWHGKTAFDLIDFLATNVMLPVGGLLIAVFAGRMMSREATAQELGGRGVVYASWSFLIRYITPIAVAIVFLHAVYDFVSQVSAA